jgi:hypothetical protein
MESLSEEDVRAAAKCMGYDLEKYEGRYQLTKLDERQREIIVATSLELIVDFLKHWARNFASGERLAHTGIRSQGVHSTWLTQINQAKAASRTRTPVRVAVSKAAAVSAKVAASSSRIPDRAVSRIVRARVVSKAASRAAVDSRTANLC